MTMDDKERLEKALRNAKASMEISGFTVTEELVELVRAKMKGEITEEEFNRIALEHAKGQKGSGD